MNSKDRILIRIMSYFMGDSWELINLNNFLMKRMKIRNRQALKTEKCCKVLIEIDLLCILSFCDHYLSKKIDLSLVKLYISQEFFYVDEKLAMKMKRIVFHFLNEF